MCMLVWVQACGGATGKLAAHDAHGGCSAPQPAALRARAAAAAAARAAGAAGAGPAPPVPGAAGWHEHEVREREGRWVGWGWDVPCADYAGAAWRPERCGVLQGLVAADACSACGLQCAPVRRMGCSGCLRDAWVTVDACGTHGLQWMPAGHVLSARTSSPKVPVCFADCKEAQVSVRTACALPSMCTHIHAHALAGPLCICISLFCLLRCALAVVVGGMHLQQYHEAYTCGHGSHTIKHKSPLRSLCGVPQCGSSPECRMYLLPGLCGAPP